MMAGLLGVLGGDGVRGVLQLVVGVVVGVGGVVRASSRAHGNLGTVGLARVCVGGRQGGGGEGQGQGGQLVQWGVYRSLDR